VTGSSDRHLLDLFIYDFTNVGSSLSLSRVATVTGAAVGSSYCISNRDNLLLCNRTHCLPGGAWGHGDW
jgi:hypothetical protein